MKIELLSNMPGYWLVPDGKGSWISSGDLVVHSERLDLTFTIPKGSHNNLASIPRIFRTLFPANAPHRVAAVIHDYLYEKKGYIPECDYRLSRKDVDGVFLDAMKMEKKYVFESMPIDLKEILKSKYPNIHKAFDSTKPLVNIFKRNSMHKAVRAGGWVFWNSKG